MREICDIPKCKTDIENLKIIKIFNFFVKIFLMISIFCSHTGHEPVDTGSFAF